METRLAEIFSAINEYYEIINAPEGLIPATKLIISNQIELLDNVNNGRN